MAAKVLLVEDDNNLREIYQARLQAEGYDIVSAKDGEEALVIAKQEQPDLIISDVMMPRVSGFEMLDILRNTEGLKDPKVIMLTALGQADDKNRADELGADRYLVKSQVTLEDIVKAAQDLLAGGSSDTVAAPAAPAPASSDPDPAPAASTPVSPVVVDTPLAMPPSDPPAATDVTDDDKTTDTPAIVDATTPAPTAPGTEPVVTQAIEADPNEKDPNDQLIADALKDLTSTDAPADTQPVPAPVEPPAAPAPEPEPVAPPAPAAVPAPQPAPAPAARTVVSDKDDDDSTMSHKRVISPISQHVSDDKPDINTLLAREEAKDAAANAPAAPAPAAMSPAEPAPVPMHTPGNVIAPPAPADTQPVPAPVEPPAAPAPEPEPVAPPAPAAPTESSPPKPEADDELDPNAVAL